MKKVRQVLNTCSPLEKIVKINEALGSGVSTLSKKLCTECKDKNCTGKKPDCAGAKKTEKNECTPCKFQERKDEKVKTPTSSLPGCMPFSDNVPIKPIYPKYSQFEKRKCVSPSQKDKACSCSSLGKPLPPEDQ